MTFGVFIPFFFVVSGMRLDIDALFASPSGVAGRSCCCSSCCSSSFGAPPRCCSIAACCH